MIGVQDEDDVERVLKDRVGLVLQLGHLEQHREKVAAVAQLVIRIDVGQPAGVAIRPRRQRGNLANQAARLQAQTRGLYPR